MRKPPSPEGRTHVDAPAAARALDFANALYGAMLRALAQGFSERAPERKRALLDVAIEGMFAISPVARHLTRLPASPRAPGLAAGMTFAMLRDVAATPDGDAALAIQAERLRQLADGAGSALDGAASLAAEAGATLRRLADRLDAVRAAPAAPVRDRPESKETPTMATDAPPAAGENPGIETAEGRAVTISFETKRCIHARFCVLQQPGAFKANVVGAWIAPDDATSAEGLVAVAQNCPSGAIRYRRRDGGPEEAAPPVNLIRSPSAALWRSTTRRSAIARRCAAAASRRTSRSATAPTRAPNSPRPANPRTAT
jgi:uncharacterized Fe-S cluster protein YjdI